MTMLSESGGEFSGASYSFPEEWLSRMEQLQISRDYIHEMIVQFGPTATADYIRSALDIIDIDDEYGRPLVPG